MRALVSEEFGGPLTMKEVATPQIGPYEALRQGNSLGRNVVAV